MSGSSDAYIASPFEMSFENSEIFKPHLPNLCLFVYNKKCAGVHVLYMLEGTVEFQQLMSVIFMFVM